jgi:CubicO group peptidase (beta-lactamase class C family)
MQLVDEGRVDIDAPIQSYLPHVRFADGAASARITVRHLLNHTSGVDGDYFGDFGYGDDAIERYVAACRELPQLFEPGAMFSYCNAGFTVLGRLLEVMHGTTYHEVLRDRIVRPLGAASPKTLLQEIVMHRVATGHDTNRDGGEPEVVARWGLPHAGAPKGSTTCATVRDVIEFARMHLDGGRDLLSAAGIAAMQRPEVQLPSTRPGDDGGTLGQTAYLRVSPDAGIAVALLTNSYTSRPLYDELFALIFGELATITKPDPESPPAKPPLIDTSPYVGVYKRLGVDSEVYDRNGSLFLNQSFSGEMANIEHKHAPQALIPANEEVFFVFNEDTVDHFPLHFLGAGDGRPRYMYDGRIARRVS